EFVVLDELDYSGAPFEAGEYRGFASQALDHLFVCERGRHLQDAGYLSASKMPGQVDLTAISQSPLDDAVRYDAPNPPPTVPLKRRRRHRNHSTSSLFLHDRRQSATTAIGCGILSQPDQSVDCRHVAGASDLPSRTATRTAAWSHGANQYHHQAQRRIATDLTT